MKFFELIISTNEIDYMTINLLAIIDMIRSELKKKRTVFFVNLNSDVGGPVAPLARAISMTNVSTDGRKRSNRSKSKEKQRRSGKHY